MTIKEPIMEEIDYLGHQEFKNKEHKNCKCGYCKLLRLGERKC